MAETVFLYKILDAAPADPLPTTLPATELDKEDGFIHLSTAKQTRSTADLFFSQKPTLWILQLRARDLDGDIQYSPALPDGGGRFPHVHDSRVGLGRSNIEKVIKVSKAGHEKWSSVPELLFLTDD